MAALKPVHDVVTSWLSEHTIVGPEELTPQLVGLHAANIPSGKWDSIMKNANMHRYLNLTANEDSAHHHGMVGAANKI